MNRHTDRLQWERCRNSGGLRQSPCGMTRHLRAAALALPLAVVLLMPPGAAAKGAKALPAEVAATIMACAGDTACTVRDIPEAALACIAEIADCGSKVSLAQLFRILGPCIRGPRAERAAACPEEVRDALSYEVVAPFVDAYGVMLDGQVTTYRTLPGWFVTLPAVAAAFSGIDLGAIRYAEGIDTWLPGYAFTLGTSIYFPRPIDLRDAGDVEWMLHEITHVRQYLEGGEGYLVGYFGNDAKIDFEIEADANADALAPRVTAEIAGLREKGLPGS